MTYQSIRAATLSAVISAALLCDCASLEYQASKSAQHAELNFFNINSQRNAYLGIFRSGNCTGQDKLISVSGTPLNGVTSVTIDAENPISFAASADIGGSGIIISSTNHDAASVSLNV